MDDIRRPALRPLAAARVRRLPARAVLAGIVAASTVAHLLLASLRLTPNVFPDEYLYASLGRSIAEGRRPLVRGGPAHFPALLEPILTAPA